MGTVRTVLIAGLLAMAACQPAGKTPRKTMVEKAMASGCLDRTLPPSYGVAYLEEGFSPDPWHTHVIAGGPADLSGCGEEGWRGHVAVPPDFDLTYRTSGGSALEFRLQSSLDTILLVSTPDGRWLYNDDPADGDGEVDPVVTVSAAPAGVYSVWAGSFAAAAYPEAVLFVTEAGIGE